MREKYLSPDLIVTCLLARFDHGMEKVWKKFGKIYRDPSVRANPLRNFSLAPLERGVINRAGRVRSFGFSGKEKKATPIVANSDRRDR